MAEFEFKLPLGVELTRQQRRAIDSSEPIFLTGLPGTGKTVVSIYRLKESKNSILFTFGKLLKVAIENTINDESKIVANIHRWHFDLNKSSLSNSLLDINIDETIELFQRSCSYEQIIIDEGQDIEPNAYKLLSQITPRLSISADNAQKVYESGADEEAILEILPHLKKIALYKNFRNSYKIYNFGKEFVPDNPRAINSNLLNRFDDIENEDSALPEVYILDSLDTTVETIRKILDNFKNKTIGILCENIVTVETYHKRLKKNYQISSYTSRDKEVPTSLFNIVVTTFKSSKGMEFDIVIMPQFQHATSSNRIEFYIGATRARERLYILAINEIPDILEQIDKSTYKLIKRL